MKNSIIYKIKEWALYLFIFSIPYEYWDPFGVASFLSVTKLSGFVYFIFSILSLNTSFTLTDVKHNLRYLFAIWFWIGFLGIIYYWPGSTFFPFNFTFLQCIFLYWLVGNDLLRNPRIAKYIWLYFILGVSLMCILAQFGVGIALDKEFGEGRFTFFGSNSNSVGIFCTVSIVLIIVMSFNNKDYFGVKTYMLLAALPNLLLMLSLSGSRGSLISLVVALAVFFLFYKTTASKKSVIVLFGSILIFFFLQNILESEIMSSRISHSTNDGLGGREDIWDDVLSIFYDQPFFGWGSTGYEKRMIEVHGHYKDTHNLFLHLMVTGGTVALILYLLFLKNVFKFVWKSYQNRRDLLPLVMSVIFLLTIVKAGGVLGNKFIWLLLAYISYSYKQTKNLGSESTMRN